MANLNIHLAAKEKSYPIIIEKRCLDQLGKHLSMIDESQRITVITDQTVNAYYGDQVVNQLQAISSQVRRIVVPDGEGSKSMDQAMAIYQSLLDFNMCRSDIILALGGGVVGDLAGYVAASFLRGLTFIQIPTSLLAQVDASVGGKVAINLEAGKNLLGHFYHPRLVLIDPLVLDSLKDDDFADGMAEVIKYGCIQDAELFYKLKDYKHRQDLMVDMEDIIYRCCQIKAQVVQEDEKDRGQRMILNFGHSLGHAIEAFYHYRSYSHGQGVAIGMVAITQAAESQGLSPAGLSQEIIQLLKHYHLPCFLEKEEDMADIIPLIKQDKKNIAGQLQVILLNRMGQARIYPTQLDFFDPLKEANSYDRPNH